MQSGNRTYPGKLFIVSEYVYSEQNSTGYFWSKLIGKANSVFPDVFVITPTSLEEGYKKSDDVKYLEFESGAYNKNNFSSRLIGQARQCLGFLWGVIRNVRRGDIVLTGTNPALLLVVVPLLKAALGFRWCLLVHDVFPENLVPAGVLNRTSMGYRFLKWLFDIIYARADHLVVIGRDMKELLAQKTGRHDNITVIQNWVDEQDVVPIKRADSELINELGWQDRVVFQFFGNIGRVQGVDNILAAVKLVKDPRASFLFIGDGAEANAVREFVNLHNTDNVAYIGSIEQAKKNIGLAACDVALITLTSGMLGLGVPSKAYFSMAADKPLLAVMDSSAEVALMVQEDNVGWTCPPSNPAALASLIDTICAQGVSDKQGRPRKVLQEKYSEAIALEYFANCLRFVAKNN